MDNLAYAFWQIIIWKHKPVTGGRFPGYGFYKLTKQQTYAMGIAYDVYGILLPVVNVGVRLEKKYVYDR